MSTNSPTTALIQRSFNVPQLIGAMLKAREHVSDLIFSPGRAPQVEVSGQLVELKFKGLECLVPGDTDQIAKSPPRQKINTPPKSSRKAAPPTSLTASRISGASASTSSASAVPAPSSCA